MTQNSIVKNYEINKVFGNNITFIEIVRGAIIDNEATFETEFYGQNKFGVAKVDGKYDKKNKIWNLNKLEVYVKEKEEKKLLAKIF